MHSIRWPLAFALTAGASALLVAGRPWLAIVVAVVAVVATLVALEHDGAELELGMWRIGADRLELVLVYAWQMTNPSSAPANAGYAAAVARAVAGRRRR